MQKKNYSIDTYASIIPFLFYVIYKIYLNYLIHLSFDPSFLRLTKYKGDLELWSNDIEIKFPFTYRIETRKIIVSKR